ncbi:MAG: hypothetical protein ACE5JS_15070 [Nitrospinota bacterium]
MKAGRLDRRWAGALGILLGLWSCAAPQKPLSPFETLLSSLMDVPYRATLVYARTQDSSYPLAVILDPHGGARLSILPLSYLEFETEDLGESNRKDLIAQFEGMESREFGGRQLRYIGRFSTWKVRPIVRYGASIGHVISVDPRLRFELRTGTSGRVFSLVLRPSQAFLDEVREEE